MRDAIAPAVLGLAVWCLNQTTPAVALTATHTRTPTATRTETPTPTLTSTACAGNPPIVNPVTPVTERLTQRVTGCGRGMDDIGGSRQIYVNGSRARTKNEIPCFGLIGFEAVVGLPPGETTTLRACHTSNVCSAVPCTEVDGNGDPLEIEQRLPAPQPAPARFAYVANESSSSVLVIDIDTHSVGTTLLLEHQPRGVAVTPDGNFAYVTGAGGVTVIDTADNTIAAALPFQGTIGAIAINSEGSTAYATVLDPSALVAIDTATRQELWTIPLSNGIAVGPHAVAVHPDGSRAYIARAGQDRVTIIDTDSGEIATSLSVAGASAVAMSPNGARAYVTSCTDENVAIIDTATTTVLPEPIAVQGCPVAAAVAPDGTVYVATGIQNFFDVVGRVAVIDPETDTVRATVGVGFRPTGLSVGPDGAFVYVTNEDQHTVSVIDSETDSVVGRIDADLHPKGVAMGIRVVPPATSTATPTHTSGPCITPSPCPTDTFRVCPEPCACACATITRRATNTPTPTPTATRTDTPTRRAQFQCAGDCDRSGTVTIDELVLGVSLVIRNQSTSECSELDLDGSGRASIDEVLTAVSGAMGGCPGIRLADLVPLEARSLPCPGGCGPQRIEICVANRGSVSAGAFEVAVNDRPAGDLSSLAAMSETCIEALYPFPASPADIATVRVDDANTIPEQDEGNNQLTFPAPNPTACDVICGPARGR